MERELEFWPSGATAPHPIHVKLSSPVPDAPYWSCRLEITGFDSPYSMPFPGVDAIDAWLSAISMVPHVLRSFTPPGARITWQARDDLGFTTLALGTSDGEAPACRAASRRSAPSPS